MQSRDDAAAKSAFATSRYLMAGRTRIHYRVEGRGPTLLLLHGELSSLAAWDGWIRELAASFRIIRIDLPGFGLSDHLASDDYTPEHALELVERVRANFHLDRFHVAGHSLGAFFAWYYAAHHPDRIDRLVLIDPIGYPQKMPAAASALAYPLLGEIVCLGVPRFLIERLLQTAYGDPQSVDAALIERSCAFLSQRRNRVALIRTLRRLREYRNNFELCRSIALVRAPTLLLWGGRDRWVPPSLLQHWRRDLPAAQVKIYPALGHLPMEELPKDTARDVHAFLSGSAQPAVSEETSHENVRREPVAHARGA